MEKNWQFGKAKYQPVKYSIMHKREQCSEVYGKYWLWNFNTNSRWRKLLYPALKNINFIISDINLNCQLPKIQKQNKTKTQKNATALLYFSSLFFSERTSKVLPHDRECKEILSFLSDVLSWSKAQGKENSLSLGPGAVPSEIQHKAWTSVGVGNICWYFSWML